MLGLAVVVLGLTVLLGGALIVVALRDRRPKPPPIILALLHGLAALIGLGALLWALQGPARGVTTGTQYFGIAAAILLLLAAILGVTTLVLHLRRRRLPGFLAGAHATIAIIGTVILLAYFLLG